MPAFAAEPHALRFATEEWPPFFSSSLPGNGLTGTLIGAVATRMGLATRIDYFPWKRAMEVGLHDVGYAGVVALIRNPEREKICYFSSAVGSRQTVLAYLKDKPVTPAALTELQAVRIGTVGGYSYGEPFDALARGGTLTIEAAISDEINLRKLFARRFGAIVIEKRMLRYLLAAERYTPADRARVGIADHLFPTRSVHVCFQHTRQGLEQQQAFDQAARAVDLSRIERDYWRGLRVASGEPTTP
ncbi:amino acid ABC transporter substrate-binding protein, PAAT family [Duganella sp. CF517]|uniref:substrate-binding periplasmic protein n=1 Tax=Duganella sp. CF517 TaxID=1881038 RepID=UPI0008D08C08|nr:transporter substrate-binding domain-containing protein [Duganella sp. CF517]SEO51546.1 amino acid ABC transporter substrate-binding protein, PAAT family [Duganella sp. CF517]